MKKFFAIAIALMMVLSISTFAADYEVDIASITEASENCVGEHDGANFSGPVIMFHNGVGINATLGEIDLSKYSKVIFEYGSDPTAYYLETDLVVLKDANDNELGSFMPSIPTGFWGAMTRTSEIELNTDYNGKVVLYSALSAHGISICNITFVEKGAETEAPATEAPATEAPATEAPATEAPATEAPATEAPATEAPAAEETKAEATAADTTAGDDKDEEGSSIVPIIIIAAVVVVAAVAVVVIMKKKK